MNRFDPACIGCGPPPPATGACCAPDGTCSVETEAACLLAGGTYQGDGVSCGSVTCPTKGACCVMETDGTFTCSQKTEAECTLAGGTFRGLGVSCGSITCVTSSDEVCGYCTGGKVPSSLVAHITGLVAGPDEAARCAAGFCDFIGLDRTMVLPWVQCCAFFFDTSFTDCGSFGALMSGGGDECGMGGEVFISGVVSVPCFPFVGGFRIRAWLTKDASVFPHEWRLVALMGLNHDFLGWVEGALFKSGVIATGDGPIDCSNLASQDLTYVREFHCNVGTVVPAIGCVWSGVVLNLAMGV